MATVVKFEIAPSYVDTFIKYREIPGGCVIPVRKQDTGEFGALLICHTPSVSKWESQMDKIKWIVSCYCSHDEKSPFGGNKKYSVQTEYFNGTLTASLENPDRYAEEINVPKVDWQFNIDLNQLEVVRLSSNWTLEAEHIDNEFQIYWDYYDYYVYDFWHAYKLEGCQTLEEVQLYIETGELY